MRKILIVTLIIWLITSFTAITSGKTGTSVKPGTYPQVHGNIFFDPQHFYTGSFNISNMKPIYGAVVPHHLVADKLIAEVFACLKKQKPSTIVVIGPNHQNKGGRVLTSSLGWQTHFGVVEADESLIAELKDINLVQQENGICGQEHSIGNIMPFIKYYLPQTKVVPIILRHDISSEEADKIGAQLAKKVGEDVVIVASVDFSHFLTPEEAEKKDQETLEVLHSQNMGRLFTMDDEYLDSPPSIGVLFSAMRYFGLQDFSVLNHTNSGDLLNNRSLKTTSYITMLFNRQ